MDAMELFVADAEARGGRIETGGCRIGNEGFFFSPTVMTNVSHEAKLMNHEPFGPLTPIIPFRTFDDAIADYDAALKLNSQLEEALYGRGLAKLKKGDRDGGNADIAAAKAIRADIADDFARYGVK
jgi:acyl-CoA reductase-like NAD-dependent aldehyde dehydrogenase